MSLPRALVACRCGGGGGGGGRCHKGHAATGRFCSRFRLHLRLVRWFAPQELTLGVTSCTSLAHRWIPASLVPVCNPLGGCRAPFLAEMRSAAEMRFAADFGLPCTHAPTLRRSSMHWCEIFVYHIMLEENFEHGCASLVSFDTFWLPLPIGLLLIFRLSSRNLLFDTLIMSLQV